MPRLYRSDAERLSRLPIAESKDDAYLRLPNTRFEAPPIPFGGGAANQMFGASKSADFIEKATWYLAIALFVLCLATTFFVGGTGAGPELLTPQ